jgi:dihydropteroate synthase
VPPAVRRLHRPGGPELTLDPAGPSRLMGVLNLTPDSFFPASRLAGADAALARAEQMVAAGADLLDLGAESTRPGHAPVAPAEQLERLLPVLRRLRPRIPVPISIDTTRAAVAAAALDLGADWINDTSALTADPELGPLVARAGCPLVLMHRFAPPRTAADGADVVGAIARALAARVAAARAAGVPEAALVLDPGIGFGTRADDAPAILAGVPRLRRLGRPLLCGPSRKSFLQALTGRPVEQRLAGTAAAVACLALAGVEILRVHDVAEMHDVVSVVAAVRRAGC